MRIGRSVHLLRFHRDERLSPHFHGSELVCPCCGVGIIALELVENLEWLRDLVGEPLRINSAYRCPVHNAEVGGRPDSYHLLGLAVDVAKPEGVDLVDLAWKVGFTGIIEYETFVHMDLRLPPYVQRR